MRGPLASVRVRQLVDLDTVSDGGDFVLPAVLRSDGWSWSGRADRMGTTIRLRVVAVLRAADGSTYASHAASLLLVRDAADTVRVLARGARF